MRTLYDDGIRKVMKGVTTIEEVFRIAKRTEQDVDCNRGCSCGIERSTMLQSAASDPFGSANGC